jgi:protein required for attachment to host cells
MDATWIVSANAGRARFFAQTGRTDPLQEINELINSAARLRTAETESDSLGQMGAPKGHHRGSSSSAGQGSDYEPEQTPAEHQTEVFARSVAGALLKAHQEGRYKRLFLVASPEFLGVLRRVMNANLQPLIVAEINKDYTQLSPGDLNARVRDYSFGH